jgi:hypothetical protein
MNTFAAAAVATAVAAVAALLAPPLDDQAALLERGRACVQRYDAGELAPLWDAFSPEMQKFLSLESLTAFREQTRAQLGTETAVVEESADVAAGVYRRVARFEKFDGPVEVVFAFDGHGKVATFYIRPVAKEAESAHLEYETKARLRLPFETEWFVVWGGRTIAQNQHAATKTSASPTTSSSCATAPRTPATARATRTTTASGNPSSRRRPARCSRRSATCRTTPPGRWTGSMRRATTSCSISEGASTRCSRTSARARSR